MKHLPARLAEHALELVAFDGKHFRLVSPKAFAPGQPLPLTLDEPAALQLDLKSLGSVLRADGRYDVRARAATLRKEARALLLSFFQTV
jgi:hypothetical protein